MGTSVRVICVLFTVCLSGFLSYMSVLCPIVFCFLVSYGLNNLHTCYSEYLEFC